MVTPTAKELIKVKKDVYLSKDNVVTLNTGQAPTFGVFFDGTNNNYKNDRKTSGNDNSPSNITKLWELYLKESRTDKHYEHGVGTTTDAENSDLDAGFAYSFGSHLQHGVDATKNFCSNYKHSQKIIIDVFGFSRGAACARAFVNEVLRSTQLDPMFWYGPKPEFRFVGLFDTVGSVGLAGDNDNDNWMIHIGNQLTGPAILDLHEKAAKKVVQLSAGDEIREYFPLSSLKTKDSIPGNFIEEQWPGAHSDIGGGYGIRSQTIFFERVQFNDEIEYLSETRKAEILQQAKSVTEQYYPDHGRLRGRKFKYKIEEGDEIPEEGEALHETLVFPTWQRTTINEIPNITLERMHQLALNSKVPFEPINALEKVDGEVEYQYVVDANGKKTDKMVTKKVTEIDAKGNQITKEVPNLLPVPYKVSAMLRKLVIAVKNNGTECPEYDVLYRKYIHHSHQYAKETSTSLVIPNKAEKHPDIIAPNGKREMFYNNPSNAIDPDNYEFAKSWDEPVKKA